MELWSSGIKIAGRDLEFLVPPKLGWKANTGGFFWFALGTQVDFFLTLKFYTTVWLDIIF